MEIKEQWVMEATNIDPVCYIHALLEAVKGE
jgi:hypothetical protein